MEKSGIFVGLDIGTTSIKVIVAEYLKNQINIIGVGNELADGLNRGVVVDIDRAVQAIKRAVAQAEEKANLEIKKVQVGLPANLLEIEPCNGMVAVSNHDGSAKEINEDDVIRVTKAALTQQLPPEREVVDVIPDEFIVDGFDGIKDPRGMVGIRLEMKGVVYTGPKTILHNTLRCVERAGLQPSGVVVAPLALANAALSDGEQDFGSILIDLGGGQTTVAVIHDHKLKYTYVDQEGGQFVTKDISIVLNTSVANAEKIKRNYGYADSTLAPQDEKFPVEVVGQAEPVEISSEYLAEIIEARLTQIFDRLKQVLDDISALKLPGGVIITGGQAALPGVKELAAEIFATNVRLFIPQQMGLRHPSFSQVIGQVEFGCHLSEIEKIAKMAVFPDFKQFVPIAELPGIEAQDNQANRQSSGETKNKKEKSGNRFDGIKNFFSNFFD
ncbi:cell division protein FtsA [Liquorilactobacillus sicerae]|uniref:cell division protein FtsA n=1 Tax=Liquorilactobacillus sicerae TaxID=1416943 RepID=UPI0024810F43|nr:cell division protein FtsA [Liquorilactobacillus sicerae]